MKTVMVNQEPWELVGQKGKPGTTQHVAVLVKRDSRRSFLARLLVSFAVVTIAADKLREN